MHYGDILKRAVDITWRNKILWVFGILAAIFGGTAATVPNNSGTGLQYVLDPSDWAEMERFAPRIARTLESGGILPALAAIGFAALLFGLIMLAVSLIARYTSYGALIGMVDDIEEGRPVTLNSGLRQGWGRLLRLLAIDLLLGIAGFVVALPVIAILLLGAGLVIAPAVALFAGGNGSVALGVVWLIVTGIAWLAVLVLVIVVLSAFFTVLREYAYRSSVLDERGIFEAISDAWHLIWSRLRESGLMWLLLALVNMAVGLVLMPFIALGVAFSGAGVALAAGITRSWLALAVLGVPLLALAALVATAASGIYQTFVSSTWTLTYRELRPAAAEQEAD